MRLKLLLFLSLMMPVWADFEWPRSSVTVRVNGDVIQTTWRNEKPYVSRDQTVYLFHIRDGPDELDLIQVLNRQGFTCRLNDDQSVDCLKPLALTSAPSGQRPRVSPDEYQPDEATAREVRSIMVHFVAALISKNSSVASSFCDFEVFTGSDGPKMPASAQVGRAIGYWSNRTFSEPVFIFLDLSHYGKLCQVQFLVNEQPREKFLVNLKPLNHGWKITGINLGEQ